MAFNQCEQGVVFADADIGARVELGATLRTMMAPALMCSPPKALTPNILGLESRPLRVEPPPFFCAMV